MAQAKYPEDVAQRVYDILDANRTALGIPDKGLYYGDQDKIPVTPTYCVEPGPSTKELAGALYQVEVQFELYVMVYHSPVKEIQTTQKEVQLLASAVEELFHLSYLRLQPPQNPGSQLPADQFVVQGHFVGNDPGYTAKNNGLTLMRAVRLTWQGKSKIRLGA